MPARPPSSSRSCRGASAPAPTAASAARACASSAARELAGEQDRAGEPAERRRRSRAARGRSGGRAPARRARCGGAAPAAAPCRAAAPSTHAAPSLGRICAEATGAASSCRRRSGRRSPSARPVGAPVDPVEQAACDAGGGALDADALEAQRLAHAHQPALARRRANGSHGRRIRARVWSRRQSTPEWRKAVREGRR